jgi:signal transduction histidine kinase
MVLVTAMTVLVVLAFAIPLAILVRHTVYARAVDSLQDTANRAANTVANYTISDSELKTYLASLGNVCASFRPSNGGDPIGCALPGGSAALPEVGSSPTLSDGNPPHGGPAGGELKATRYGRGMLATQTVRSRPGSASEQSGTVVVYASDAQLHRGERGWWLLLGLASLGLIALGIGAAELLTRRLIRPLTQTADTATRISSGDITARAPTGGPAEIAQVGAALNQLADRIDQLIADERETVADLSHRLRTPMTVLRLDVEGLRNHDEAERMGEHVAAMERTLTSVIRAARRPQREGRMASCDAAVVLDDRVEFWTPLAEDQGREMTVVRPPGAVEVRCSEEDLSAALDALLENVMAHTTEGVACSVALATTSEEFAEITVRDEGGGFDSDAVTRGRSDRGSSGLGLDIARRCAEASGGRLTIASSGTGGATVVLQLGRV